MGEKVDESRSGGGREAVRRGSERERGSGGEGLQGKRDGEGMFGEVAANFLFGCSCDIFRTTYSHYPLVGVVDGCFQGALGGGTRAPPLMDG